MTVRDRAEEKRKSKGANLVKSRSTINISMYWKYGLSTYLHAIDVIESYLTWQSKKMIKNKEKEIRKLLNNDAETDYSITNILL